MRAQRNEYVAAFEVKSATGQLTITALGLAVDPYDEEDNYRRIRNRWFGSNGTLFVDE